MTRLVSFIPTKQVLHLAVEIVYPPIPTRAFDWSAIDTNTYDADCDQDGYYSNCPRGAGFTELDAINDLFDQMEERL